MPVSGAAKGKNTFGNTSTEAMPNTKKSKYSDARPITTPSAMSLGLTSWWLMATCASRSSGWELAVAWSVVIAGSRLA